jgi:hypothetical protein
MSIEVYKIEEEFHYSVEEEQLRVVRMEIEARVE